MGPLLGFGAKSQHVHTPLVVLECTPALPTDMVHAAFGWANTFSWPLAGIVAPDDVGFELVSRRRLAG